MGEVKDLTGQRFNMLVVLKRWPSTGKIYWECKCECGIRTIMRSDILKKAISCGCQALISGQTHGLYLGANGQRTPFYRAWAGMMDKCYNPNHGRFKDYGGRGIFVHLSWHQFENFHRDCYHLYIPGRSIDRIDNDKGYEPGNVKWSTPKEQANNRRSSPKYRTLVPKY